MRVSRPTDAHGDAAGILRARSLPLPGAGTIETLLERHRAALGADFMRYRHHAHRVAALCLSCAGADGERVELIAIAAACHDLGIWVAGTFDYLEPSVHVARDYLAAIDRVAWLPVIATAIREHHRLVPYAGAHAWLAEPFRRADWMDVSGGLVSWGLSRAVLHTSVERWPRVGFHQMLLRHAWRHARRHPLDPLPMLKL